MCHPHDQTSSEHKNQGAQMAAQQSMFKTLPTIKGFETTERDVSVMNALWQWHERSLKSGIVIGRPWR